MDSATQGTPTLQGTIVKGRERISSRAAIDALGCETKQIGSLMRSLGWEGPFKRRLPDTSGRSIVTACYERDPLRVPVIVDGETIEATDTLPAELELVTRKGLREIGKVLDAPFDASDGVLTRNKITATGIALNAQLRADEQRLRQRTDTDVLARLIKLIDATRSQQQPIEHVRDSKPSDDGAEHQEPEAPPVIEAVPEGD